MKQSEILARWLEGYRERVLHKRRRLVWTPLEDWQEAPPGPLTEWDEGYAQALADVAEHFRLGQLSPGGELYESERLHV